MSIPSNNASSGNVAFPPVQTFAGSRVFDVDSKTFDKCRFCKLPNKHYAKYLENDEISNEVREYARKKPKSKIILRDAKTGLMTYLRN